MNNTAILAIARALMAAGLSASVFKQNAAGRRMAMAMSALSQRD